MKSRFNYVRVMRGRKMTGKRSVEDVLERAGTIPTVYQYGGYDGNYGSHAMSFSFLGISFWFSYQTLIAYQIPGKPKVVLQNYWGPTTGKHLTCAGRYGAGNLNVTQTEFLVRYNNDLREYLKERGYDQVTLPDLRVDQDPKTLEYTGLIGFRKPDEPAVPEPKPPKSAYYLHPKRPSKSWLTKQAAKERRLQRQEKLRDTINRNYEDTLVEFKGEMI